MAFAITAEAVRWHQTSFDPIVVVGNFEPTQNILQPTGPIINRIKGVDQLVEY